jgi:hypothetical protein
MPLLKDNGKYNLIPNGCDENKVIKNNMSGSKDNKAVKAIRSWLAMKCPYR